MKNCVSAVSLLSKFVGEQPAAQPGRCADLKKPRQRVSEGGERGSAFFFCMLPFMGQTHRIAAYADFLRGASIAFMLSLPFEPLTHVQYFLYRSIVAVSLS